MNSTTRCCFVLGALISLVAFAAVAAVAADLPEAPKVSSFAQAKDLAAQLESYVAGLEETVKDKEAYEEAKAKVTKDANTVLLVALGLGLHDDDNAFKKAAPGLIEACKKVAAAKDFDAPKASIGELKKAMTSEGDPAKLSWNDAKDASLAELMLQVPLVNTKLKRYVRPPMKLKEIGGQTAVIGIIAQGSMGQSGKTKKPSEAEAWYKHCATMRDAAAAVSVGARAKKADAVDKAMKELAQSCDDCHAIFNPK
jgi:hypothetical protein